MAKKRFQGLLWSKRWMVESQDDHCVYSVPVAGLFVTPEQVTAAILKRYPKLKLEVAISPGDGNALVKVVYGAYQWPTRHTVEPERLTATTWPNTM